MKNRDIEPAVPLDPLDPGSGDSAYWSRFRSRVVAAAAPELLRRRRQAEITVADLVLSWSRLLLPGTVATAAAAALILVLPAPEPEQPPLGVEELLVWTPDNGAGENLAPEFFSEEPDLEVFLAVVEGGSW